MITSVKLPDELWEKAKLKAANEKKVFNFSELVRVLLEDYVSQDEAKLRKDQE